MAEIEITDPKINEDGYRAYSYREDSSLRDGKFARYLAGAGVTPISHPLVADVYAGDGAGARILAECGWDRRNITCIDRFISPTPLIDEVTWLYWDVRKLATRLLIGGSLPSSIEAFRGRFDVVLLLLSELRLTHREAVCQFLVRKNGLVFWS